MHDIGIIYDGSDAENWFNYLDGMLGHSSRVKLTTGSLNVMENDPSNEDLTKFIKDSLVLMLLLSPDMCQVLEEQPDKYSQCLKEHSAVVLIMCFTQKENLNTFSKHCPTCMTWKMLETSNSKDDNQIMMSEVVEMVDKLRRKHRPPPKPKPKPRQHKVKIIPGNVHEINQPVALVFQEETIGNIQIGFSDTDTLYDTEKLNPYTYQFNAPSRKPGYTKLKIYKDGREIHTCPFNFVEPRLAAYQCTEMLVQCLGTTGHEDLDLKLREIYEKSISQDDVLWRMIKTTTQTSATTKSDSEIPTILHFAAKNGLSEFCGIILDTANSMALYAIENVDGYNPAQLAEFAGFTDLAETITMFIETEVVTEACDELYMKMRNEHIYTNREETDDDDLDDYEKYPYLKGLLPKPQSFKYVSKKSLDSENLPSSVPPATPPKIGSRPKLPEPTQDQDQLESTSDNEEDLYADKQSLDSDRSEGPPPIPTRSPLAEESKSICAITLAAAEFMGMTTCNYHSQLETDKAIKMSMLHKEETIKQAPQIPKRPCQLQSEEIKQSPDSKEKCDNKECETKAQKELIDIAEGVKLGEFTLDEAERLFFAWRERNSTQSTSMKERKKMLEKMRNEYKSVFEASKKKDNAFGRLSIFGKIKNWHKRKKSMPDITISKPIGRGKGSRYTKFPGQGAIPEDAAIYIQSETRCSTLSNSSSSSAGSRDSRASYASRESSISESVESTDSELDDVPDRFDSGMDSDGQNRQSMKKEFLESMTSMSSAEPPPVPPRIGRNT